MEISTGLDDTGGGLAADQMDLYWREEDPHGPAAISFGRRGPERTAVIVTERSGDEDQLVLTPAAPWRETMEKPELDASLRPDSDQYRGNSYEEPARALSYRGGAHTSSRRTGRSTKSSIQSIASTTSAQAPRRRRMSSGASALRSFVKVSW